MIEKNELLETLKSYDKNNITIGTLGSHSALDICSGAKKQNFRTIVVCQKGREKTYDRYYKTVGQIGCVDETIVLNRFKEILNKDVQKKLLNRNTIFVPHRSFCVYVGYDSIENEFKIPLFGNRKLLKAEERHTEKNQYYLLKKTGIDIPKIFKNYDEIDRLVIVKVEEKERSYERAFFFASSPEEFERTSEDLIKKGTISRESVEKAVIEEFLVGPQFNFNFFYSPIKSELELLGIDTRRQTNIEGIVRIPWKWQKDALEKNHLKFIEVGHIASTIRESFLEKVFEMGERFVEVVKKEYPPGIIGSFALQAVVVPEKNREKIVVFDVSLRSPGSPGISYTPYSFYKWRRSVSVGERIAMEIRRGIKEDRLEELIT